MVSDPGTYPHTRPVACFVTGFQYMNTLASYIHRNISGLNPFTCVWPIIPFPLAPQAQFPSPAQSSVLARRLTFDQVGSPNSLTSVLLGALMCIPLVILSDSLHIYYETAGFIFFTLFVSIANLLILLKDGCWSGQSVGKKLCGVKVIDETTGEPGGIGASFKRNLPTLIPVAPLLIAGELWNGHRTGDRWANTKVIWKKYSDSLVFAPTHWNVHIALHKKC